MLLTFSWPWIVLGIVPCVLWMKARFSLTLNILYQHGISCFFSLRSGWVEIIISYARCIVRYPDFRWDSSTDMCFTVFMVSVSIGYLTLIIIRYFWVHNSELLMLTFDRVFIWTLSVSDFMEGNGAQFYTMGTVLQASFELYCWFLLPSNLALWCQLFQHVTRVRIVYIGMVTLLT